MKKTIFVLGALCVWAVSAIGQTNFIITNFNASIDTSWVTTVIPKLNANYGNIVGWLNALNSTNAVEDFAISNLDAQIGTNIYFLLTFRTNATYANGRNYTNIWGTNIVAGTLPTNAFAASTMAWLESLQGAFPTNFQKKAFCFVSYGEGSGSEDNYNFVSGYFGVVPYSSLFNYTLTDPGGNYTGNGTGAVDGSDDYYTAPYSGIYQITTTVRLTDGDGNSDFPSGNNVGIGGAHVGEGDFPGFGYFSKGSAGRQVYQIIRIIHLNAGDTINTETEDDSGADTASDGTMSISLLAPD